MITSESKKNKIKVNFTISRSLFEKLEMLVPAGQRSSFVSQALTESLKSATRKKAVGMMDEFRKKCGWKMSENEIRKARAYGRE